MGSCLSCKSGGRAHSYTTINMESEKIGDDSSSLSKKDAYARNNNVSFGFKRRVPTVLKSLSQERTSELVQNYENKIANVNSNTSIGDSSSKCGTNVVHRLNTNNRTLSSNIPRYGSKISNNFSLVKATNAKSSSNPLLSLDSNCNTVNAQEMTPEASSCLLNGEDGHKSKSKPSDTNRSHSKHSNCFLSSSDCKQTNSDASNHKNATTKLKPSCDGDAKQKGRIPRHVSHSTATSGLPRPQTLNVYNKNAIATRNSIMKTNFLTDAKVQAPLAKLDDMEAMQLSSDAVFDTESTDSGSLPLTAKSVRDHSSRSEAGSDKTARSVASPSQNSVTNVGKNQSIPIRKATVSKTTEVNAKKCEKSQTNMNIAKPRSLPIPTKSSGSLRATSASSSLVKKVKNKVKMFNGIQKRINSNVNTKSDKVKCPEQKDALKPPVSDAKNDINRANQSTASKSKATTTSNQTAVLASSKQVKLKATAPSALGEKLTNGEVNEMSSSIESSGSRQDSSTQDTGLFSPPSERDQFLIDDEIADQPELMACHPHEYQRILQSSQDTFLEQDLFLGDIVCESGEMCRSASRDTLCSAESINSDDLMLDFDQEDAHGNAHSQSHMKWTRSRIKSTTFSDADAAPSTGSMTAAESEDAGMRSDTYYYSVAQEVGSVKAMLLQLQKALTEAETLNPFDSLTSKNGLCHSSTQEVQYGPNSHERFSQIDEIRTLKQDNFDLQRQVVFLQQQLEEKSKACKLLQHQLTKLNIKTPPISPLKDVCNAATQTDKPRLSLTTMSQSYEDSLNGTTTVSSNEFGNSLQQTSNSSSAVDDSSDTISSIPQVTGSLNSLLSASTIAKRKCNGASALPERCLSAVDLHHSIPNTLRQPVVNNYATKSTGHVKSQTKCKTNESKSAHSKIALQSSSRGRILPEKSQLSAKT